MELTSAAAKRTFGLNQSAFFVVAKQTMVRGLSGQQKFFCDGSQLRDCKEVAIFWTSILCP